MARADAAASATEVSAALGSLQDLLPLSCAVPDWICDAGLLIHGRDVCRHPLPLRP